MTHSHLIQFLMYAEIAALVAVLGVVMFRRQAGQYPWVIGFVGVRLASNAVQACLWWLAHHHILTRSQAYPIYFYAYYGSYAVEALFQLGIVYGLYRLAMQPLKGLQSLGTLMFRWAAAIACVVSLASAVVPNAKTPEIFMVNAVAQLQRTQSILTLCLLLFVTFAIRPMGLSYRSRIFGIGLGLGLLSTTDLVGAAWVLTGATMVSAFSVVNGVASLSALLLWIAYLAAPEPKRRMIVLPTTSPFHKWNLIAEILGVRPGYVAVSVTPDMFAPAEIEVMKRASVKMAIEPTKMAPELLAVGD